MNKVISTAFLNALFDLFERPHLLESVLKDKRMTLPEKEVLKAHNLIRDNKNQEIIDKLADMNVTGIVESVRMFVLGIAYNNMGQTNKAVELLYQAHRDSLHYENTGFQIITLFNLYNSYYNLKNFKQCSLLSKELAGYTCKTVREKILSLRVQFLQSLIDKKNSESEKIIEELKKYYPLKNEFQNVSLIYDKIDFYLTLGDLKKVEAELDELKKHKKYFQTANFKFMKAMTNFILYSKPIYLYEKDFKDAQNLWDYTKVVLCLCEGNQDEALFYWNKLKQRSPEAFGAPFDYRGGKNFFYYCLEKLNAETIKETVVPDKLRPEELISFLQNCKAPVNKDLLYKALYGELPVDKDDYQKLKLLISRMRKRHEVDIRFSKNCYYITPKAS